MKLVLEPDDVSVDLRGRAAAFGLQLAVDLCFLGAYAVIAQRNCYAEMPVSRARRVSSSEVADFR